MNPESLTPLTFGLLLHHPQLLHSDKSLKELFTKLGTVHEFTQYEQPGEGSASFVRLSRSKQERFACFFYSDRVEIVHDNPSSDVKGFWRVVQDILKESVRAL